MPIDPVTGLPVEDPGQTSLVDPATGMPVADVAPAVPEQTTMQRIQAGIDSYAADLPQKPEGVTQFDMMAGQPGLDVGTAPPQVTPVVKQTVREKVKGKPGQTQEVVRETTIEPTTVETGGGTRVSSSESRTAFDPNQLAEVDKASGRQKNEKDADDLRRTMAESVAATTADAQVQADFAKRQAELQARLDSFASGVANEGFQKLAAAEDDINTLRERATAEVRAKQAEWDLEKKEFARLVATSPTSELYSSAGGAVGIGMIMTQAMGAYLTAMGVQNNLGEQMNQWVDRAQAFHKQRIEGKKSEMDALGQAIDRIWSTATSEIQARHKTAEVGLLALDHKLEVEKLKTSSEIKLASITALQSNIRKMAALERQQIVSTGAKDIASILESSARRSLALAQAGQVRAATSIALAEWNQRQQAAAAALREPPDTLMKYLDGNGKWRFRQWLKDTPPGVKTEAAKLSAAAQTAHQLGVQIYDEWLKSGKPGGTFESWIKTNERANQLVKEGVLNMGKEMFGALTGTDYANISAFAGTAPQQFTDMLVAVGKELAGNDPAAGQQLFVDRMAASAYSKYRNFVESNVTDFSQEERARYNIDAAEQQMAGDVASQPRYGGPNPEQAPPAAVGSGSSSDRVTRAAGNARGALTDVTDSTAFTTTSPPAPVKQFKHNVDALRQEAASLAARASITKAQLNDPNIRENSGRREQLVAELAQLDAGYLNAIDQLTNLTNPEQLWSDIRDSSGRELNSGVAGAAAAYASSVLEDLRKNVEPPRTVEERRAYGKSRKK